VKETVSSLSLQRIIKGNIGLSLLSPPPPRRATGLLPLLARRPLQSQRSSSCTL
jgi:hypothetical protein